MAAKRTVKGKRPTAAHQDARDTDNDVDAGLDAEPAPQFTGEFANAKRARFVEEYLIDRNATQAAIRAGYSDKTAYSQGSRLLKDGEVQAAIAAGTEAYAKRAGVSAERVLQELGFLAMSDIGEILSSQVMPGGRVMVTIRNLDDLTPAARRCIKSIKQTAEIIGARSSGDGDDRDEVVEKVVLQVELHPKVAALEMLMAHHGLNAPVKLDVAGTVQMVAAKESLGAKLDGLRQRTTQPGGDAGEGPEGAG